MIKVVSESSIMLYVSIIEVKNGSTYFWHDLSILNSIGQEPESNVWYIDYIVFVWFSRVEFIEEYKSAPELF